MGTPVLGDKHYHVKTAENEWKRHADQIVSRRESDFTNKSINEEIHKLPIQTSSDKLLKFYKKQNLDDENKSKIQNTKTSNESSNMMKPPLSILKS